MLHFLRYLREPWLPFLVFVIVFVIVCFVFLLVSRASTPRLRAIEKTKQTMTKIMTKTTSGAHARSLPQKWYMNTRTSSPPDRPETAF